jgi:hypothetical protein
MDDNSLVGGSVDESVEIDPAFPQTSSSTDTSTHSSEFEVGFTLSIGGHDSDKSRRIFSRAVSGVKYRKSC